MLVFGGSRIFFYSSTKFMPLTHTIEEPWNSLMNTVTLRFY